MPAWGMALAAIIGALAAWPRADSDPLREFRATVLDVRNRTMLGIKSPKNPVEWVADIDTLIGAANFARNELSDAHRQVVDTALAKLESSRAKLAASPTPFEPIHHGDTPAAPGDQTYQEANVVKATVEELYEGIR